MKKLLFILSFGLLSLATWAVPANPRPMEYVQPNGDTIVIRLVGDEHFHYTTTVDGVLISKNDKGYFCYAKWQEIKENGQTYRVPKPTCRKARNADKRSKCEQRWVEKQAKKNKKARQLK